MHVLKLTSNSAMVRSVRSKAEDQGSKPGSVTSFFQKTIKSCAKNWEGLRLEPGTKSCAKNWEGLRLEPGTNHIRVRSLTTAPFLCLSGDVETHIYFMLYDKGQHVSARYWLGCFGGEEHRG
jgi:hypothetical protein